ncbi:flagellar hook-associated protein FlgK [Pseudooceanicola sp. 216_PA32_1]|uniref:Flagellar hook-associated protein 1 n=1 Tax=Pseudooceanicola pacificus TaxID=2676438 RepID=A0A844W0B0_9RHOB|nr:flagellar hook-associated protein FlgK [Pseudooceanicola pacificus]MWB76545.1 flagellar hook-associated protein FlgK [Pseudooceanicola pacificus]
MSISVALSNALSGLTASSRMASIVSTNVANALTEGYGRRELAISPRVVTGGGVGIDGVIRHVDASLVAERRDASSEHAGADTLATYRQQIESLLGTPEDGHSLSAVITRFESALVAASSRPDLPERLTGVLTAAGDVAGAFGAISDRIQGLREEADAEIDATVNRVNELLAQVVDLNGAVTDQRNRGGDVSGLLDHRQKVVDELSGIVPVREVPRGHGSIALFTPGGAILVDGTAADLDFTRTNVITPHLTADAGLLSGLTLNGRELDTTSGGPLDGGRLSALFAIRDDLSVAMQSDIDAAARDMIERFQQSGLDATRATGDPGLFTDNGLAFDPGDELGIAARIAINALVDPDQGGATWRLRDGLGAAAAGAPGDASLLQAMQTVLAERRTPGSGSFGTGALDAAGIASSLLSLAGTQRQLAEQTLSFAATRHGEVEERFLADGVDTDQEMQRLILIEQAYGANAKVVQTIDEMMNMLLRI